MVNLNLCIPIRVQDPGKLFLDRYRKLVISLQRSLLRLGPTKVKICVYVVFNGKMPLRKLLGPIDQINSQLIQVANVEAVTYLFVEDQSKITAVNFVLSNTIFSDGVVVCDDDIILPANLFFEIIQFFQTKSKYRAICFNKTASFSQLNDFQRFLTFNFHPTVRRLREKLKIVDRKPLTGSFYAINLIDDFTFPDPCSEADIFYQSNVIISDYAVVTEYPNSIFKEIDRRAYHVHLERDSPLSFRKSKLSGYIEEKAIAEEVLQTVRMSRKAKYKILLASRMQQFIIDKAKETYELKYTQTIG